MKKRKNIYLFLLLIFVLCISTSIVHAKTLWATCSYDFQPIGHDRKTLYFSIYDTGELTIPSQYVFDPDYQAYTLHYHNQFNAQYKAGLYSNGKIAASCPKIWACSLVDEAWLYMNQPSCPDGSNPKTLSGKLTVYGTGKSDSGDGSSGGSVPQKEDKSKTFCSITKKLRNQSYSVVITFFLDSDGNRKFSVYKEGTNEGGETDANGQIWIGTNSFKLNSDDIDKYYNSSTCSSTAKYFDLEGSNENITIGSEQPEDYNNGEGEEVKDADRPDMSLNVGDGGSIDCNSIFSGTFGDILQNILDLIKIAIPIIVIGLSAIDYMKALLAQNSDEIKKATQRFIKRLIIGVAIFALPVILELLMNIANAQCTELPIK